MTALDFLMAQIPTMNVERAQKATLRRERTERRLARLAKARKLEDQRRTESRSEAKLPLWMDEE